VGRAPTQFIAVGIGLIGLLSLVGHAYGVEAFTGVISYSPMAIHTAIAFSCIGFGLLLSRPQAGLMRTLTSALMGGVVARQFLPIG
jgi:hypothetical protein